MDRHSRELVSNNDRDGYGSVTKKVNSRCFKLYLAYSVIPSRSICQMFVLFSGVEYSEKTVSKFGQLPEKKTKVVVLSSRPPQNVK